MKSYFTAIGSWGDVLACLGNIYFTNPETINIIYFGFDPNIKNFLEIQPKVREVVHIIPKNDTHFLRLTTLASMKADLNQLFKIEGKIIATHVDHDALPNRNFQCNISKTYEKNNKILFQPYSLQSNRLDEHWPFWMDALNWLLEENDIILTGNSKSHQLFKNEPLPEFPTHPRLTNLIDQTDSMEDVFALAEACKFVITTNNCLASWTAMKEIPALIMHTKRVNPYFYRWINCGQNIILPNETTLEEFKAKFLIYYI